MIDPTSRELDMFKFLKEEMDYHREHRNTLRKKMIDQLILSEQERINLEFHSDRVLAYSLVLMELEAINEKHNEKERKERANWRCPCPDAFHYSEHECPSFR